jgi:ribosomal protein S20
MPISLSAKKSLRKSIKNNRDNFLFKTKLKLTVKKFLAKPSTEALKEVCSFLDKAVKKGIYHKNKTARLKASYTKKVKDKDVIKKTTKTKVKAAKKA